MSDVLNPTVVSDDNPNGGSAANGGNELSKDSVSFDTHLKLLNQRKADQAKLQEANARLAEFEANQKAQQEQSLKDKEQWKQFGELKEKELAETRGQLGEVTNTIIRAEKLDAFQTALGGELAHNDFQKMINLDSINYTESGEIDGESLSAEVNRVRETYGDSILKVTNLPKIPGGAPVQSTERTYAQMSAAEKAAIRKAAVSKL